MAELEVTAMTFSHIHTEEATAPHTTNSKVGKSQMMLTCLKSNPIREGTRQLYSARASTGPPLHHQRQAAVWILNSICVIYKYVHSDW